MRRFLAAVLSVVMLLSINEVTGYLIVPATVALAAEVTDAYDAYKDVRKFDFDDLYDDIREANARLEAHEMQNEMSPGSDVSFNRAVNEGLVTSPGYAIADRFNQRDIDGTAQVKSGLWLTDTTYDATAGTPTTEDLFITIGGTKYIVDIAYEYVYRPYLRRYHFQAGAANYRYYYVDPNPNGLGGAQMKKPEEWVTTFTSDWHTNMSQSSDPGYGQSEMEIAALYTDDFDFRTYNLAYVQHSLGYEMNAARNDVEDNGQGRYLWGSSLHHAGSGEEGLFSGTDGDVYETYTFGRDNWYACDYKSWDSIGQSQVSPGMYAAIQYKHQVAEIIEAIKVQYASIDSNYRADEGSYNVDSEDSSAIYDNWENADYLSFIYTYYGMVLPTAGGNGTYDGKYAGSTLESAHSNSFNGQNSVEFSKFSGTNEAGNYFKSENVFAPLIVSYLYDMNGYGREHLDSADMPETFDSHTHTPFFSDAKGNWASCIKQNYEFATHSDQYYGLTLMSGDIGLREVQFTPTMTLALKSRFTNLPFNDLIMSTDLQGAIGKDALKETGWYKRASLSNRVLANCRWFDTTNYNIQSRQVMLSKKLSEGYPLDNIYKFNGLSGNSFTYGFDKGLSYYFTDAEGTDNELSEVILGGSYNQLSAAYTTAMTDLYTSFAPLFYDDELKELFGSDLSIFPSLVEDNVSPTVRNDTAAYYLYMLFGIPIVQYGTFDERIGIKNPYDYTTEWALPWAVFPEGGDLDGGMEDFSDNTVESGFQTMIPKGTSNSSSFLTYGSLNQLTCIMTLYPQYVKYTAFKIYVEIKQSPKADNRSGGNNFGWTWHNSCDNTAHLHNSGWKCTGSENQEYGPHNSSGCGPVTTTSVCSGTAPTYTPKVYGVNKDCESNGSCSGGNCGEGGCTETDDCECDPCTDSLTNTDTCNPDGCDCEEEYNDCDGEYFVACTKHDNDNEAVHFHSYDTTHTNKNTAANHGLRNYKESITVESYSHIELTMHNADSEHDNGKTWTNTTKYMSYSETFAQLFRDVRYINLISYGVWTLDRSEIRGLSSLLAQPINGLINVYESGDALVTESDYQGGYVTYDVDETTIHNNPGTGSITLSDGTIVWNNLELQGRVANSFHAYSQGNVESLGTVYVDDLRILNKQIFDNVNINLYAYIARGCDVPFLQYYSADGVGAIRVSNTNIGHDTSSGIYLPSNYAGGDYSAFHLQNPNNTTSSVNYTYLGWDHGASAKADKNSDDMYFIYNPYSQGGRSHSTFGGFVVQALAHTLHTSNWNGDRTAAPISDPAANSLRIQGDYLAIVTVDKSVTLVGSMYDTAGEVNWKDSDYLRDLNKFKFLHDWNNYKRYTYRLDYWVPGRLSYILARAPYSWNLYGGLGLATDLYLSDPNYTEERNLSDCWVIHTFCRALNGYHRTNFDANYYAENNGLYEPSFELWQGNVNPYANDYTSGQASNYYGVKMITPAPQGTAIMDTVNNKGEDITLAYNINTNYSDYSVNEYLTLGQENNRRVDAIIIDLNYEPIGGRNFANWRNQQQDVLVSTSDATLPYIGYQTNGDGVDNITKDGSGSHEQLGYSHNLTNVTNNFDPNHTMVSLRGSYYGGFDRFGINLMNDVYVKARKSKDYTTLLNDKWNKPTGDETPTQNPYDDSGFSKYYPWGLGFNADRYLPNGRYYSSQVYNIYENLIYEYDGDLDKNRYANGILKQNAHYTKSGDALGNKQGDKLPNEIVIYNPATTSTAHVLDPSSYLPDASNYALQNSGVKRYLAGYDGITLRDQRVGRHLGYGTYGEEDFTTADGVITRTPTVSTTEYTYELKHVEDEYGRFLYYESNIDTQAYTMTDYDITYNSSDIIDLSSTSSATFEAEYAGIYKAVIVDSTNKKYAIQFTAEEGDIFYLEDDALFVEHGSKNYSLLYDAFRDAYRAMEESEGKTEFTNTTDFVPIETGMIVNPMNATFSMKAGDVISLSLPLANASGDPTGLPFMLNLSDKFQWHYESSGMFHTIYIEALEDAVLNGLEFEALTDFRFLSFTGSAVESEAAVLISLGKGSGLTQTPVEGITTIKYLYESETYSRSTTNRWGSYNSTIVDIIYTFDLVGMKATLMQANHCYLQSINNSVIIRLDQSDPHKVPHTNWRYYVLGWKTEYGDIITSVYDDAINAGSDVRLIPPIGDSDDIYLTADILDAMAANGLLGVGRYHDDFYLMEITNNSYSHRLEWYGLEITAFDTLSFGTETSMTEGTIVSWEQTSWNYREEIYYKSYELVFHCSSGVLNLGVSLGAEVCAYDVKYSGSLEHKKPLNMDLALDDWTRVPRVVNQLVKDALIAATGDYLSLDDEFTIYWDNTVDLVEHNKGQYEDTRELSSVLGRGWDGGNDGVNGDCADYLLKESPSGYYADYWNSIINAEGSDAVTDATKWIYSKYVTFNVDMYGFTEGPSFTLQSDYNPEHTNKQFDPTTPAFNDENGTPNNIVYIPAGTPVHLGYFKGDSADDNDCKFVDYGYNYNSTKDPNGDFYTYHFWVPLSDGESDSNVVVEYHVTSINNNDGDHTGQGTWNRSDVYMVSRATDYYVGLDTNTFDEWGNEISYVGAPNIEDNLQTVLSVRVDNEGAPDVVMSVNRTSNAMTRYTDSYKTGVLSIVGRIGGLTVVDSADPRYQDSFKQPGDDFAITPIVKAVKVYSNKPGQLGSQIRYLTDYADVRGRLGFVPSQKFSGYYSYNVYNTYGSQWFHEVASRFYLPMSSKFNIHEGSNLPEQRLGYEIYCSLETIGNYYGSSWSRGSTGEVPSNMNDDYGQTKVQVRPMYIYLNPVTGEAEALDVYMRRNGNYVLLNAGSMYSSNLEDTEGIDGGPYWMSAAFDAYYVMSIKTNTLEDYNDVSGKTYRLDQTLMRRMVTELEASYTWYVMNYDSTLTVDNAVIRGIHNTILEPFELDSLVGMDDGALLDFNYYYGNSQIMFLREYNRTFIGEANQQIQSWDEVDWSNRARRYGQKWYFGISLPSSAIFVRHGETKFTEETIINGKEGYILVVLDVYAIGEKWILHYQSEISDDNITIDDVTWTSDQWKVYPEQYPYLLPVSMYRASQLAAGDLDTRGTY